MKEGKNMSQKEIYLTADQYVVKCLEEKEEEISKLNKKYDDLLKKFVTLQADSKKIDELKKLFKLEDTSSGNGYQIAVRDEDGDYLGSIAYCWNKENLSQHFINLLDILGLELPGGNK